MTPDRPQPNTCACSRPLRDNAVVCDDCLDLASAALTDVPGVLVDLGVMFTRRSKMGEGDGRGGETPVPFDDRASQQAWSLTNCLVGWARIVSDGRSIPIDCGDKASDISRWLLSSVVWLQHHEAAPEFVDEICDEVRQARRMVDRPIDRWFAGPCSEPVETPDGDVECDADLYAFPGSKSVVCRKCDAAHDVAERRRWLLAAAEDHLAHAELIGRALSALGERVTPAAIRGYVHRGKVIAHGKDRKGRDLYRVGDVIDAARDAEARKRKTG